ncbi:MAG: immunity 17 family protein [Oscillospiraceae bacterium]|nr:immunity 17 family protein [Oscillospiraceae bacterium]
MNATSIALLITGGFLLLASWRDWDWFFDGWRLRILTELFGRENTRRFYMILGGALVLGGLVTGVS